MSGLSLIAAVVIYLRSRKLARQAELFRAVAEGAKDGLLLQTTDSRVIWANAAYGGLLGRDVNDVIGRYPLEYAMPEDIRPSPEEARAFRFDPDHPDLKNLVTRRNVRGDGTEFINQISVGAVIPSDGTGKENLYVTCCRDVTLIVEREQELKRAHDEIERRARIDDLTGLANRAHLTRQLEDMVEADTTVAVFAIDLNEFKSVNDARGHAAGDAALRHVARALSDAMPQGASVGRLGGDEFLVIAPWSGKMLGAARAAVRMWDAIASDFRFDGAPLRIRASIGVAISRDGGTRAERLLRQADTALYAAKDRAGRMIACFDARLAARTERDRALKTSLQQAVAEDTIDFHLQPTFDVRHRRVRGFEMLARWQHPKFGLILPGTLLPLLSELGLTCAFDRLAARAALRAWRQISCRSDWPEVLIGFNVSPETLVRNDFADFLIAEAAAVGVPPCNIHVEVLETTFFAADATTSAAAAQVARLREAGFRPTLDDFGAGYAGLSHLAAMEVEGLKIDRSLTARITEDETSRVIVGAILSLCSELGFRVVVEGVETEEQLTFLADLGCEVVQGYYIGRPAPLSDTICRYYPRGAWRPQVQPPVGLVPAEAS